MNRKMSTGAAIGRAALAACLLTVALLAACRDGRPAALAAPAAPPGMGAFEAGTNRQGRDLSEFGARVGDAAGCAKLCMQEPRCKAMSYMARPPPDDGVCWLKESVPEATPNPAMVSAVKLPGP